MTDFKSLRNLFTKKRGLTNLFIILLLGILLLFLGSGLGSKKDPPSSSSTNMQQTSAEDLERKLEQTLCQIKGVGKVKVMITLEDGGSHELATDMQDIKRGEESNLEQKTVIVGGSGGSSPYVVREKSANVKGVIVVAEGGGDPSVCETIKKAVAAVLTVMPHRIEVAKMT